MLLKNTAKFRQAWKKEQGYDMPNWDENFIGANHGEIGGFYKMVNGIVNNIKADLTPKLQNAQDAQAIYEFLQNAADSQATDCAILYDENYFLVLNNGKPFSEADIKAVLNSFQGTKADKTKAENCGKIGRYGIGFKLVHRLVGKFDGADELLNDLAGPILFSWSEKKQFDDLLNDEKLEFSDDFSDKSEAAWLLKIILSCFPLAPDEKIKDLDYKEKVVFQKEEINQLKTFIQKNYHLLKELNLDKGSLIFLKFGEKKYEKLKDSLENLKSGIGYSLNLLKTLKRVVLIDEVIERFEIQKEEFIIANNTPDFEKISPEFPFCPIEITIGYETTEAGIMRMKQAPSLYQYFPMRNERHNSAFFVHATSFNKVTDRTHLDDQGESNFATLQFLTTALEEKLNTKKSKAFIDFTNLYQSILLSDKPDKYNNQLLLKYLYQPLLSYIQNNIPTTKNNAYNKELVIVKKTQLHLEPMNFGIAKEWFFWTNTEDNFVKNEALKVDKLGLQAWNLKTLLKEGNENLINEWFKNLGAKEYEVFIDELKEVDFDREFLTKFAQLKVFRCVDMQGKASFFSLEELKNQNDVFLVNSTTKILSEELKLLGFLVLEINISAFKEIQNALKGRLDYLFDNRILFQKITARFSLLANHQSFSVRSKHTLFSFFQTLKEVSKEQLKEIALFENQNNEITPLKNLLLLNEETEFYLENYKIKNDNFQDNLAEFCLKKEDIYQNIIYPNFEKIIIQNIENKALKENYAVFIESIIAYFKIKKGKTLSDKKFIFTKENFVASTEIFYDLRLNNVDNYEDLSNAIFKLTNLHLPEKDFLKYYTEEPFKLQNKKIQIQSNNETLLVAEKNAIFKFFRQIGDATFIEKIALFKNQLGESQLPKNLLSPDLEVPIWLNSFKINQLEFNEDLKPYLCRKEDIYQNIIFPLWDTIVAQSQIIKQENIVEFYQAVKELFLQNRNNKILTGKKYIFINKQEGFEAPNQVFFHQKSLQVRGYNALQRGILKGTNLKMPDKNVYDILLEAPFKTEENSWVKSWKNDNLVLQEDEAQNLIQLGDIAQEYLFNNFVFEQGLTEKEYILSKKGYFLQAFTGKGKQKMTDAITEYFSNKYKILPEKLFTQSFDNKGLIGENILAQELLKSVPTEVLSEMLSESSNPLLLEQTLNRVEEIIVRQGVEYDKNSVEYQTILLLKQKDADIKNILPKIKIEDAQGLIYPFAEILYENNVNFVFEKIGKYDLILSEILPQYQHYFEVLEAICKQFLEIDAQNLHKKLSGLLGEKDKKEIIENLKENFDIIQNSSQLAFLILNSRIAQNNILDFKVHTQINIEVFGNEIWYLQAPDFVAQNRILGSQYADLGQLLRLNEEKRTHFDFLDGEIRREPFLDKNLFKSTPFAADLSSNSTLQMFLLEYIFEQWQEKQPETIVLESVKNEIDVLGFSPSQTVENIHLALPDEEMPNWLEEWKNIDALLRLQFLRALGVHTQESESVKVRQYFFDGIGEISLKNLKDALSNDNLFVEKTAKWLKMIGLEIAQNDERLIWVRKFYNLLENKIENLPLPYIKKIDNSSIFWYGFDVFENTIFYLIDENKIKQLNEKYNFSLQQLLVFLKEKSIQMTHLDIKQYTTEWLNLEENLDKDLLLSHCYQLAEEYYEKWKQETDYEIFIYDGQIPYFITLQKEKLHSFEKGNVLLLEKQIFVNKNAGNIEETLLGVLPQNLLLLLLRYKNNENLMSVELKTQKIQHQNLKYIALKEKLAKENTYQTENFDAYTAKGTIFKDFLKDNQPFVLILKEIQNNKITFNQSEIKAIKEQNAEFWIYENNTIFISSLSNLLENENLDVQLNLNKKEINEFLRHIVE
ncbi:MAG: ATP-binding protein [Cytophagales bacterium]|nr:MAG: ATP-binding protein [Cytophagales bacterium]